MNAPANPVKEPYELDPDFEKLVLFYAASRPKFWGRIGHILDAECMENSNAKLLLDTIRLIAKDRGGGPDGTFIVIQRLQRRVHEGKVTPKQVAEIDDLFEEVEEMGARSPLPTPDSVVDELVPVMQRRLQAHAIALSIDEFGRKGDFSSVRSVLDKAANLGLREQIAGTRLGPGGFEQIEAIKNLERLPTGILELDLEMNKGLARRQLGVWVADSGGGKSMCLVHQAGECVFMNMFVGFITLELPEAVQLARIYANITGVPTNHILDNDADREEAKRRVEAMIGQIGICEVAEFAPQATTVRDIIDWIDQKEQEHGMKMQCLVVDYADKLFDPRMRTENEYVAMKYVYEGLRRDIAVARGMWVWTASQASRPNKESGKRIDLHHIADSMHKVRVADVVITLNHHESELELFVAKNRMGRGRFAVGPLFTDFERARVVPRATEFMQW